MLVRVKDQRGSVVVLLRELEQSDTYPEHLIGSAPYQQQAYLPRLATGQLLEPKRSFVVALLSAQDIWDMFQAQSLLAGELAERAAARIDQAVILQLGELQSGLTTAAASRGRRRTCWIRGSGPRSGAQP